MEDSFYIKFWGVRGTISTPDTRMMRYGGHTSCVEVRCGDVTFALDAGTGIVNMAKQQDFAHMHLLLSHTHIDHIMGLCAMECMFRKGFAADIWAGHLLPDMSVNEALRRLIEPPLFPVPLNAMQASLSFHDFTAGESLEHSDFKSHDIQITTLPLHHPDKATGYRIDYRGHSVCYITDIEHRDNELDAQLIRFVQDCDIFIYDSTYDERQFSKYKGWGHSTWQHALRLGEAAHVGKVVMFHHDPSMTDEMLDARAKEIEEKPHYPFVIAQEGLSIELLKANIKKLAQG